MDAMLVIKTRNGYAIAPFAGEIPQTSIAELQIAVAVEDSAWSSRGKTVADVLKAHFEPPKSTEDTAPLLKAA